MDKRSRSGNFFEVLQVAARLGLTSFGGPIAHIGYFRREYVERRRWLGEQAFADLVALCQFLPGPASSQLGIAIGTLRAGVLGGIAAWLGFTLPSAIALVVFGFWLQGNHLDVGPWLHGLMIVAVAVVAQAVIGMKSQLAPDRPRATLAFAAAITVLLFPSAMVQVLVIGIAAMVGLQWLRVPTVQRGAAGDAAMRMPVSRTMGGALVVLFLALLFGLPLIAGVAGPSVTLFETFFRVGSLVFGGGHVVLPLLQSAVVPRGWVTNAQFLAGYGAAQAVPGPLFSFAAYLGAVMRQSPGGVQGAILALLGIYLPSFLLVLGVLPFWHSLRGMPRAQGALRGVNAAVVGLLIAALYHPVFTSAIRSPLDLGLALAGFAALEYWKLPPWVVVVGTSLVAAALGGTL